MGLLGSVSVLKGARSGDPSWTAGRMEGVQNTISETATVSMPLMGLILSYSLELHPSPAPKAELSPSGLANLWWQCGILFMTLWLSNQSLPSAGNMLYGMFITPKKQQ